MTCVKLPHRCAFASMAKFQAWTTGKAGSLSPWSQAVVVALLKKKEKKRVDMSFSDIAREVVKVGGGHQSKQAVAELAANVALDDQWHPGKISTNAKKRGPKPRFTRAKQLQVAKTAMTLKKNGAEVTVGAVLARAPKAATNPKTGELYTSPTMSKVFKEHCFDEDKADPWLLLGPCHKAALPPWLIEERKKWAQKILDLGHTSAWYYNNCVWFDPCNTVIPGARRTVFDHGQNAKGKRKRWMSKGNKMKSQNLVATPYAAKQKQWADKRVWWFVAMARGKVVLHVMPPRLRAEWPWHGGVRWQAPRLAAEEVGLAAIAQVCSD